MPDTTFLSEALAQEFSSIQEFKVSDFLDLCKHTREKTGNGDLSDADMDFVLTVLNSNVHPHIIKVGTVYKWVLAKFEDVADLAKFLGFNELLTTATLANFTIPDLLLEESIYKFMPLKSILSRVIPSLDSSCLNTYMDYINNYCPETYVLYLKDTGQFDSEDYGYTIGTPCNFNSKNSAKAAATFLASSLVTDSSYSMSLASCVTKSIIDGVRASTSRLAYNQIKAWSNNLPVKLKGNSLENKIPERKIFAKADHRLYSPTTCSIVTTAVSALTFIAEQPEVTEKVLKDWFTNKSGTTLLEYLIENSIVPVDKFCSYFGFTDLISSGDGTPVAVSFPDIKYCIEHRLVNYKAGAAIDDEFDDILDYF